MPRLDQELVTRGLCESRARATRALKDGHVRVNGQPALKPSQNISKADHIEINDPSARWVSRAALKILPFLAHHQNAIALDLGASTGGFTQALLEAGASKVFAVDVGHGQLHPSLQSDPRVLSKEGLNVKDLTNTTFSDPDWPNFSVITADLSFISLKKALPATLSLAQKDTIAYLLIKPQFELEPAQIGKGGIVKSETQRQASALEIIRWLEAQNWRISTFEPSPVRGQSGNQEFVVKAKKQ